MMRDKLLCILHRSPPSHGAAKVGDFIASSEMLKNSFHCRFITIKSSESISDIGKFSLSKVYSFIALFCKVFWALIIYRPNKIYYTSSVRGVAFYRDFLVSFLWKGYALFKTVDVFYHYHTKGVGEFVESSKFNRVLTGFFVRGANLILLSPYLKDDFSLLKNYYKDMFFLPNGVSDPFLEEKFDSYLDLKFSKSGGSKKVLYISNMIKSKGYFEVLKLASMRQFEKVEFHFAGGWQCDLEQAEFFEYIKANDLNENVTFHGFVSGKEKDELFKSASVFIFPTRYHNEAFPLSLLESLSYGVPIIATDEASIPSIVDKKSGVLIKEFSELPNALSFSLETMYDKSVSLYCRGKFLREYDLPKFESNFVEILKYE